MERIIKISVPAEAMEESNCSAGAETIIHKDIMMSSCGLLNDLHKKDIIQDGDDIHIHFEADKNLTPDTPKRPFVIVDVVGGIALPGKNYLYIAKHYDNKN